MVYELFNGCRTNACKSTNGTIPQVTTGLVSAMLLERANPLYAVVVLPRGASESKGGVDISREFKTTQSLTSGRRCLQIFSRTRVRRN